MAGELHNKRNPADHPTIKHTPASSQTVDKPEREYYQAHPALETATSYLLKLEVEVERLKRDAAEQNNLAKAEIRHLVERSEKAERQNRELHRTVSVLETRIDDREGVISEERKKFADLDKQFRQIRKEVNEYKANNSVLEEKLDQLEKKREEEKKEIERLLAAKSRLESRLEDREALLEEERRKYEEAEKNYRRVNTILSEAKSKNALLEERYEEIQIKHKEEITKLSNRVVQEAKHEVRSFMNRVEANLSGEYRDYQKMVGFKMTEELGDNFRLLAKNLFARLNELGLEFKSR